MFQTFSRWTVRVTPLVCLVAWATVPAAGQHGTKNGEWRSYAGEPGGTKYSPLDQINKTNAKDLRIVWRFKTDHLGPRPEFNYEVTPLMVSGVLYAQAGSRRDVVALDPTTGEMLWMWRMDEGERGVNAPRPGSGRGVAYWTDGRGDERIFTITPGYKIGPLFAPPVVRGTNGRLGNLQTPSSTGGANWEGGAFDLETGMLYVFSSTQASRRSLVHDPSRSAARPSS